MTRAAFYAKVDRAIMVRQRARSRQFGRMIRRFRERGLAVESARIAGGWLDVHASSFDTDRIELGNRVRAAWREEGWA
jgi:hypothetical protein